MTTEAGPSMTSVLPVSPRGSCDVLRATRATVHGRARPKQGRSPGYDPPYCHSRTPVQMGTLRLRQGSGSPAPGPRPSGVGRGPTPVGPPSIPRVRWHPGTPAHVSRASSPAAHGRAGKQATATPRVHLLPWLPAGPSCRRRTDEIPAEPPMRSAPRGRPRAAGWWGRRGELFPVSPHRPQRLKGHA